MFTSVSDRDEWDGDGQRAVSTVRLSIRRGPSGSYVYWNGTAWVIGLDATVNASVGGAGDDVDGVDLLAGVAGGRHVPVDRDRGGLLGLVDTTTPNITFTYIGCPRPTRRLPMGR